VTTDTPANLYLVVGYDGSPPAGRALDAAVSLLHGRAGHIEVLYVAHLPAADSLSADAIGELEIDFDDIAQELRTAAAEQLSGREDRWEFARRNGQIAEELIAFGSSSQAMHRIVGSAAVALARHSPVPIVVVP
jgi:nucleotide-binding universal stress UspA family protein